ncbi:MAG: hypothetical protein K1X92_03945 [Bacteroidia bacterium]|nr:hypothetical protein [Bacteroidia bacterium]
MKIHYLGIRHHGPGSSRNLVEALKKIKPDAVLLEMPSDIRDALEIVQHKKMKPPVALLIYNPDQPAAASYYPFAEFSPEWQAVSYCLKNNIHLRCFDLPKENWLALTHSPRKEDDSEEESPDDIAIRHDPLGYIGRLAGYADGERWWEEVIEKQGGQEPAFQAIMELMTALRSELNFKESYETELREAKMRTTIRETIGDNYQNIAIVCGAWHTPALPSYTETAKEDEKLLKKLKKVPVNYTWIPWTYERLSTSSGYGAGVVSPAWYDMLFKNKREKVLNLWMTRAAGLLRQEQMDASSAHIIEAVRLANTLAIIREQAIPGLQDMMESATTIFGGGYPETVQIIEKELIIGTKMGAVPNELKNSPLRNDLEQQLKKLRMMAYWGTPGKSEVKLDLREPRGLEKSRFLHRMSLLEIKWAEKKKYSDHNKRLGSEENWTLKWKPEMEMAIIEAGVWGNTVYDAVSNLVANRIHSSSDLSELTKLLKDTLRAELPKLNGVLLKKIKNLATQSRDIFSLMDVLPDLVSISRYSTTDIYKTDLETVRELIDEIIPRICISLPYLCVSLDAEASNDIWGRIKRVHEVMILLGNPEFSAQWFEMMDKIVELQGVDGKIAGGSVRILNDSGKIPIEKTRICLSAALSSGMDTQFSMRWLDGFLMESVTILLYNPDILSVIDAWLHGLKENLFIEYVAVMRKVFSRFSVPERQKIMNMLMTEQKVKANPNSVAAEKSVSLNTENANLIESAFKEWTDLIYKPVQG